MQRYYYEDRLDVWTEEQLQRLANLDCFHAIIVLPLVLAPVRGFVEKELFHVRAMGGVQFHINGFFVTELCSLPIAALLETGMVCPSHPFPVQIFKERWERRYPDFPYAPSEVIVVQLGAQA